MFSSIYIYVPFVSFIHFFMGQFDRHIQVCIHTCNTDYFCIFIPVCHFPSCLLTVLIVDVLYRSLLPGLFFGLH